MQEIKSQILLNTKEQQPTKNNSEVVQSRLNLQQKTDTFEISTNNTNKTDKANLQKLIAVTIFAIALTAGVFFAFRKGKNVKLNNIEFDKGVAYLKDKTKFSGTINDTLLNGDKILMEYKDGIIQKSIRKGNVNCEKIYEVQNGEKIIKKTTNGITTEFNITKTQSAVKKDQETVKKILSENDKLTSAEFLRQSNSIKFKSEKQKTEISKIFESKKQTEKIAEEKAQKAACERLQEEIKREAEEAKILEAQRLLAQQKIKTKNGLENLLGTDISDELFDYITQNQSEFKRFDFNDINKYLANPRGYDIETRQLYMHISTVLKNKVGKTPLETEKIKLLLLELEDKAPGLDSSVLTKWNILTDLQKLYFQNPAVSFPNKEKLTKQYTEMVKNWLGRLDGIAKFSQDEQTLIMQELCGFKCGIGNYSKATEVAEADFIDALLAVGHKNQSLKQKFNDIALNYAKTISPAYENATKHALESNIPGINLLYRKGDNLIPQKATKLYDEKTANFIWDSYINCGDDTMYGAYFLNDCLRDTTEEGIKFLKARPDVSKVITKLDEIIKSSEKLDKDYVVYRAIGLSTDSPLLAPWKKVGNVVTDKAFVSTSHVSGTYLDMFGGRQGTGYRMRIKLPMGTQGINMHNIPFYLEHGKHNEFLLPRNSSFKVTAVDETAKIIDLDYILPT